MKDYVPRSMPAFAVLIATLSLASASSAQVAAGATRGWSAPRTPWGDPDLAGIWTNTTTTPFERPKEYGQREFLTKEEFQKALEDAVKREEDAKNPRDATPRTDGPEFWYEHHGKVSNRTSQIADPPDGQLPPLANDAAKRRPVGTTNRADFDTWEDLSTWDRCITRGLPGSMLPTFYNNNYQILQSPGYVVILYEMIHDARVIPVDGRAHLPSTVRQWMGDSRGHWEGSTLVVEVTNFTNQTAVHPVRSIASTVRHTEALRVLERFTRVDADTIEYEFTVDDPKTFARSWTARLPMTRNGAPDSILEYACHEGNHAIANALSGSRAKERKAGAR